jgi:ribosomal protein S18 acetylase RimI-like enzyme
MSSLYAQYIKEREGREIIEKRWGFITYKIAGEECDIDTVYIVPEYRNAKAASSLTESVIEIAKAAGCKTLIGYNDPETDGSSVSMKAMLAFGFELSHIDILKINVLRKEI